MQSKIWFALLLAILQVNIYAEVFINTQNIDEVRSRVVEQGSTLGAADRAVIEEFLRLAYGDMLLIENVKDLADLRDVIIERISPDKQSAYFQAYLAASVENLKNVISTANDWENSPRKAQVLRDSMIIAYRLGTREMIPLAAELVDSPIDSVKYWAVKNLTSGYAAAALAEQGQQGQLVIPALEKVINDQTQPEVLLPVVRFAKAQNSQQATNLLVSTANLRMNNYRNWKVEFALLDQELLIAIAEKINKAGSQSKAELAPVFAQYYSYAIQMLIKGGENLDKETLAGLRSLIVAVEQSAINEKFGITGLTIKKNVEQLNYERLTRDHNDLLGGGDNTALLAAKFNFKYADGGSKPAELPDEPAKGAEGPSAE